MQIGGQICRVLGGPNLLKTNYYFRYDVPLSAHFAGIHRIHAQCLHSQNEVLLLIQLVKVRSLVFCILISEGCSDFATIVLGTDIVFVD